MKIQTFLFIAALLVLTGVTQDGEGGFVTLPPGRRELDRKVRIPGINGKFFADAKTSSLRRR